MQKIYFGLKYCTVRQNKTGDLAVAAGRSRVEVQHPRELSSGVGAVDDEGLGLSVNLGQVLTPRPRTLGELGLGLGGLVDGGEGQDGGSNGGKDGKGEVHPSFVCLGIGTRVMDCYLLFTADWRRQCLHPFPNLEHIGCQDNRGLAIPLFGYHLVK